MGSKFILFCFVILLSIFSVNAFYDHATNVYDDGELVQNGNLRILIYEAAEGGSAIYNETFIGAINNGMWSVHVDADLVYGRIYFKDYEINGQNIDFNGVDRLAFVSRQGIIDASNITSGVFDVSRIPVLSHSNVDFANQDLGTGDNVTFNEVEAGAFYYSSDYVLKENIRPLESTLRAITQIRPKRFSFVDDNEEKIGVIAQDVEEYFPEFVSTNKDGIKTVDYPSLVIPLLKAVQEQQDIIEAQNKRLNYLENKIRLQQEQLEELRILFVDSSIN